MPSIRKMLTSGIPELVAPAAASMRAMMVATVAMFGTMSHAQAADKINECECISGIVSKYGQCWICTKERYREIKVLRKEAKTRTRSGGCYDREGEAKELTKAQCYEKASDFEFFANVRDQENICWDKPHQSHIDEANRARNVAKMCKALGDLL